MKHLIPQGYSRDIWTVFFCRITTAIGFSVSMPYLNLYLHNELGISMTISGAILASASIVGAILAVYGGDLSDRMGRKWVMVRALFWRFLTFMLMAYVISKKADVYIITGLLILNSAFGSFFMPASMSYIADLTVEEKRTSAYGLLRIGGNLGWALGPAIGGLLATISYSYLFYFTGGCMLIATIILLKFSKESLTNSVLANDKKSSLKEILSVTKDRRFLTFIIICLIIFIAWGQLIFPFSVFTVNHIGITKTQLGVLFSINGFMVVLFQYFITGLIPVRKQLIALVIGSFIYGIGYFSVGLANGFTFLIGSVVIITTAEMIVSPTTMSYASFIADPHHKGRYLGLFNLSHSLGWSLAPLIGGVLLDIFTKKPPVMWGAICAVACVAALSFLVFKSRSRSFTSSKTTMRRV
jgi:MFS family permease